MARRFVDARGTEWEVWEMGARPVLADAAPPKRRPKGGQAWLCFESPTQRRRLARYPRSWQALSARELAALCAVAQPDRTPQVLRVAAPPAARPAGGSLED